MASLNHKPQTPNPASRSFNADGCWCAPDLAASLSALREELSHDVCAAYQVCPLPKPETLDQACRLRDTVCCRMHAPLLSSLCQQPRMHDSTQGKTARPDATSLVLRRFHLSACEHRICCLVLRRFHLSAGSGLHGIVACWWRAAGVMCGLRLFC